MRFLLCFVFNNGKVLATVISEYIILSKKKPGKTWSHDI